MKLRSLLLASTVAALPMTASAQGITLDGVVSLGYTWSNGDLFDISGLGISAQTDLIFSPNMSIGFDMDIAMAEVDGIPLAPGLSVDLDATRFAFEPTYKFGNGWEASVYWQIADIDISTPVIPVIGLGVELQSYGIAGAYERDNYRFAAYIGQSDTDPGLPAGFDIKDWGISASWAFASGFEIYGQYASSTLETPLGDVDLELWALGGDYMLQNGLMIFGSIGQLDISTPAPGLAADAMQYAIGVGYDLSSLANGIPAVASLEIAHTEFGLPIPVPPGFSPDQTKVTLGVTFALGGGAVSTPLDSGNRIAKGDIRSALVSGLGGIF